MRALGIQYWGTGLIGIGIAIMLACAIAVPSAFAGESSAPSVSSIEVGAEMGMVEKDDTPQIDGAPADALEGADHPLAVDASEVIVNSDVSEPDDDGEKPEQHSGNTLGAIAPQPAETPASAPKGAPAEDENGSGAGSAAAAGAPALTAADDASSYEDAHMNMYRLYNPNSGEHFYTADLVEARSVAEAGWRWEGIGWVAPTANDRPVFRLYNPNAGDHHYTLNPEERSWLAGLGWNDEGIGWYSDAGDQAAVYRQYNPNAVSGAHNFTVDASEDSYLGQVGWSREGIAWYATDGESIAIDGFWLVTAAWGNLERYWIDSTGNVAKSRLIDPAEGSGWWAYATGSGAVVRGKHDDLAGHVYVADDKGELASTANGNTGWLITSAYDGGGQRYYYNASLHAMISGWFEVDGALYFGVGGKGYVARNAYVKRDSKWFWANNDGVLSASSGPANRWEELQTQYRFDDNCDRLIFVKYAGGSDATLEMHAKNSDGWLKILETSAFVGSNGIDKVREGDRKTPTGTFDITEGFGILDNPGLNGIKYTKLNDYLWWSGAPDTYNTMVDSRYADPGNGEHLIDYNPAYNYSLVIGYNLECIYGKGSAIFLHCFSGRTSTLGCVAVSEDSMVTIMRNTTAHTKICIY